MRRTANQVAEKIKEEMDRKRMKIATMSWEELLQRHNSQRWHESHTNQLIEAAERVGLVATCDNDNWVFTKTGNHSPIK